jgi:hypothetical protein
MPPSPLRWALLPFVRPLSLALIALATGAIGVRTHDFLEGEDLLHDLLDEWRMRRMDLSELDARNLANPRRSDFVISLTTIPSRIGVMQLTIKGLLRQTVRPAEIRLHVPATSRREGIPYVVPAWLKGLKSVSVVECDDLGPATKLIPALGAHQPNQRILVVDDDRLYHSTLVEDLQAASDRHPEAAVGLSGWIAPHDLVDRPTSLRTNILQLPPAPIRTTRVRKPTAVDILQGFSAYVVRPRYFDLAAVTDYSQAPEAAFWVDDVWFGAHCRAPKLVVPTRRSNFQPRELRSFYSRTSLGLLNRGGGDLLRRNNTIMLRHFASNWTVGGPNGRGG